jgi:hypothetical protein
VQHYDDYEGFEVLTVVDMRKIRPSFRWLFLLAFPWSFLLISAYEVRDLLYFNVECSYYIFYRFGFFSSENCVKILSSSACSFIPRDT